MTCQALPSGRSSGDHRVGPDRSGPVIGGGSDFPSRHRAAVIRESAWLQKPRTFVLFSQCQCIQSSAMQKNPRYRKFRAYHGKKRHRNRHFIQSRNVQFGFWLTLRTHIRILASAFGSMVLHLR
jgi:hypothetical protein